MTGILLGGSVPASSANARKKGSHVGLALLMCHTSQPSYHLHLGFVRLVFFPIFWISCEALLPNRFVLITVHGHDPQLRSCPPLFCNFWQFNVKAAAAHHPIIQKEDG